jgi:hypothetical protein
LHHFSEDCRQAQRGAVRDKPQLISTLTRPCPHA